MKLPPQKITLIENRKTVYLVAFATLDKLHSSQEKNKKKSFFLGFYINPGKTTSSFYLLKVDETGIKQRKLIEAGDCIEYAVIVFMGMYPLSVLDVCSYQTMCQETLFRGHLSKKMYKYKKQLTVVNKRLEKIKISYLIARDNCEP